MRKGRPFAGALFNGVGSRTAVNKALSKLVKIGALKRVARGVYMRPKVNIYFGQVRANPVTVMQVITRARGETTQIHGAEAVRLLGLSTQMQVIPTYYTNGRSREIRLGSAVVRLRHVSKEWLQHAKSRAGVALIALHYLGNEEVSEEIVTRIVRSLTDEEVKKLRACKMPEWMRLALHSHLRQQPLRST
jgi:hypothetical protein